MQLFRYLLSKRSSWKTLCVLQWGSDNTRMTGLLDTCPGESLRSTDGGVCHDGLLRSGNFLSQQHNLVYSDNYIQQVFISLQV